MPTFNTALQQQLQGVLEQLGKERVAWMSRRIAAEKKIGRGQLNALTYAAEVAAWEGSWVFLKRKTDTVERKALCRRVGTEFVRVQFAGESEPVLVCRSEIESMRTPEKRLLDFLDGKIERLERSLEQYEKEMKSLKAFRARVHVTLTRRGQLMDMKN